MSAGVLYLHGFCSSPASWKARLVAEAMSARGLGERFFCPVLPPVPRAAMAMAEAVIGRQDGPLTLVGSSLGGFYATWLAEKHELQAVLINPVVLASITFSAFIGTQTNFHSGESFEFTRQHVDQLAALEVPRVTPERYLLMVETGDEVLDFRHAVARYAGCRQLVQEGGDHSFTRFPDLLPQLLEFCGL
ncbi:YqiA/YcfP family alpha/beta fold hydrolase [Propionivibrio sp.]|uniref:YqiA/YcfP family alpha/beta fold hydrolase n=1 Tax=Propionivibrio sp. TaxID=2212460 RepID=UPI0025CC31D5|nr:YqiA/YcfP family alpha/beta fold hydrolase [Propionivibrio sp.]